MNQKLRIGLRLRGIDTFDVSKPGNVQGDEQVARGWQKYLLRCDDVESVYLYPSSGLITEKLDVLIHFYPFLELDEKVKNFLYLQNAFPNASNPTKWLYPPELHIGTVGVFNKIKSRFDGYIFTSKKLMEACASGAVIPFATDPELFFPQPSNHYQHPVSFVGNDIRGPLVNQRYFVSTLPFGLVIYGNKAWSEPLQKACLGKLPMPDLPKLYSSCLINLNAHIEEHIELDTINLRIYDILACGGFILSDHVDSLQAIFGDSLVCTTGNEDEWAKIVRYLADDKERQKRSQEGRKLVLSDHTYGNRVKTLIDYLKEVL
jgi:spore maturation protein CgeB